jgi:hypothetical protein
MQLSPLYLEQLQAAKQEGKQEEQQEIALNLLRENVPVEIVSRTTGLTIEQLEQLRSRSVGSAESI